MKSWIAFLLLCFVVCDLHATSSVKDKDEKASQLYHDGKYAEALDIWHGLEHTGNTDPNLFFNIGNSESMLGHVAESVLAYEKAYRLRPYDPVIRESIKKERAKIENAVIPVNPFFLNEWFRNFLAFFRPGIWIILGLVAVGLALIKWLTYRGIISRVVSIGGKHHWYIMVIGIFLMLTGILSFRQLKRSDEAIVMSVCDCRQAASAESPVIRILHPGEKVRVTDHISDWNKISLLNLDEVWIKKECLRSIQVGADR